MFTDPLGLGIPEFDCSGRERVVIDYTIIVETDDEITETIYYHCAAPPDPGVEGVPAGNVRSVTLEPGQTIHVPRNTRQQGRGPDRNPCLCWRAWGDCSQTCDQKMRGFFLVFGSAGGVAGGFAKLLTSAMDVAKAGAAETILMTGGVAAIGAALLYLNCNWDCNNQRDRCLASPNCNR